MGSLSALVSRKNTVALEAWRLFDPGGCPDERSGSGRERSRFPRIGEEVLGSVSDGPVAIRFSFQVRDHDHRRAWLGATRRPELPDERQATERGQEEITQDQTKGLVSESGDGRAAVRDSLNPRGSVCDFAAFDDLDEVLAGIPGGMSHEYGRRTPLHRVTGGTRGLARFDLLSR